MAIDYIEIRDGTTRKLKGIIDTAESIIWKTIYYGVGEFEIYVEASARNVELLKLGNFVTRNNDINCGIISNVEIKTGNDGGRMITASGKFAKAILSQRIIYKFVTTYSVTAQILRGNVAEACWKLIYDNCVNSPTAARNFPKFGRGAINDLPYTIRDDDGQATQKQVTYNNLMEYTDKLLKDYGIGAYVWLDTFSDDLLYVMYEGEDRTAGNAKGNKPLIFSREYDNLQESEYINNNENYLTTAIIGGEGEGLARFVTRTGDNVAGYSRRETFVDDSSTSRTYKDDTDTDQTYTDADYSNVLIQDGKNALNSAKIIDKFSGALDLSESLLEYGKDYNIGDLVTIEDKTINRRGNVRITEITEVQDKDGYIIDAEYSEE